MYIHTLKLSEEHWSTDDIPISYKHLTKSQLNKSYTFLYSNNFNVLAICRAYFINQSHIEIGDVYLDENLRGKKIHNAKISTIFMQKVIRKIRKLFPKIKYITLAVHKNNIPAIILYLKLGFLIDDLKDFKELHLYQCLHMTLHISSKF